MWYNNLIKTTGKWGLASFLFGVVITASTFGGNISVRAYVLDTISTPISKPIELKMDFNPMPIKNLINSSVNGLNTKSSSQNIDFSKFFSSSKVSYTDLTSFLKEAAITGINLTILIISITTQVLKGIFGVIK